jgi:hypothetical protein
VRALFLFLLLVNIAFFAWSRFYSPVDSGVDPLPLGRQIEPEKLKVLSPAEIPPVASPTKPAAVAVAAPATNVTCMEWGSFTVADISQKEKLLEPLSLGERLAQRRTEEQAGWWVFIPQQPSRQAAMRKAAELKGLGIDDFFVVAEDPRFRWAISLGVFRNEEAAQSRLATLKDKGVRSAQVGPREMMVPKIWLQVKGVDSALEARLKEITKQVDGADLRPCI